MLSHKDETTSSSPFLIKTASLGKLPAVVKIVTAVHFEEKLQWTIKIISCTKDFRTLVVLQGLRLLISLRSENVG